MIRFIRMFLVTNASVFLHAAAIAVVLGRSGWWMALLLGLFYA